MPSTKEPFAAGEAQLLETRRPTRESEQRWLAANFRPGGRITSGADVACAARGRLIVCARCLGRRESAGIGLYALLHHGLRPMHKRFSSRGCFRQLALGATRTRAVGGRLLALIRTHERPHGFG